MSRYTGAPEKPIGARRSPPGSSSRLVPEVTWERARHTIASSTSLSWSASPNGAQPSTVHALIAKPSSAPATCKYNPWLCAASTHSLLGSTTTEFNVTGSAPVQKFTRTAPSWGSH